MLGFVIGLVVVVYLFVSFPVLQSYHQGRKCLLLCFNYILPFKYVSLFVFLGNGLVFGL